MKTYRYKHCPDHPLSSKNGMLSVHRFVLFEKIGKGTHPCHWCGRTLQWRIGGKKGDSIVADHIDDNTLNNAPDNIVASCHKCNTHRNNPNDIQDGEPWMMYHGVRVRAKTATCQHCQNEFILPLSSDRPATYCSRSCRNKGVVTSASIKPGEVFREEVVADGRVKRIRGVASQCPECGKDIVVRKRSFKGHGLHYCSNSCAAAVRGRNTRGTDHYSSRFSAADAQEIFRKYTSGEATQIELAQEYSVARNTIYLTIARLKKKQAAAGEASG